MRRLILRVVILLSIASPLHATPLTWRFSGMTLSGGQLNGVPINADLSFELRLFLDTTIPGMKVQNLPEFSYPAQVGGVTIDTHGPLPLFEIQTVEYLFRSSDKGIVFVEFMQTGFLKQTNIGFDPPLVSNAFIVSDSLGAISPRTPNLGTGILEFWGPNLFGRGHVTSFSSTLEVPERGSTAMFLVLGLGALSLLQWRFRSFGGSE